MCAAATWSASSPRPRRRCANAVQVPGEYRLEWGGQFENQQRASARLAIVVPIALALIFLLLYFTFNSVRQAVLVFCNVPFAAIGGVIALYLSGEFLSVPASVGFIALVGIAVLNGVVLVSYINRLIAENGLSLHDAVREGARRRMTPVVLTATIAAFGLVPFLFADGPGLRDPAAAGHRRHRRAGDGDGADPGAAADPVRPLRPEPGGAEAEEQPAPAPPAQPRGRTRGTPGSGGVIAMHRVFLAAAIAAALLAAGLGRAGRNRRRCRARRCSTFQDANPPGPVARPQPAPRRTEPRREDAPPPPAARRCRRSPPPPWRRALESAALGRDLDAALGIDAGARAILGQRDAIRARDAQVRSPIAGSPAIGSSFRSDTRGPRTADEWDVEIGAPMWLPGQRGALAGTVTAGVEEQARRLALRRLELAGLLRDAYWAVGLAASELGVARDRLATARDIGRDVQRRVELGDIAETEALLTRNEELAAALDHARAEAAVAAARAAYRTLTGGSEPALERACDAGRRRPRAGARPRPMAPATRRCAPPRPRWPPRNPAPGWWRRRRSTTRNSASSPAARAGR